MNPSVQINIYGGGARARQPSSPPSAQLSPGTRRPPRRSLPPRRPPTRFLPVCTALRASLSLRAAPSLARLSPGTRRPPCRSLPPRRLILSLPLSASALPVRATLAPRRSPPALCASLSLRAAPSLARRSLPVRTLRADLSPRAGSFSPCRSLLLLSSGTRHPWPRSTQLSPCLRRSIPAHRPPSCSVHNVT